jgi:methionyl aminopeptidase
MHTGLDKADVDADEFEEGEFENFKKAGKISAEALQYGKSLIKPGVNVVEVLDKIEDKIVSLGGGIAFPAQVSFNDVAAHACPDEGDESTFEDQVVKLDVGADFDGYVTDNAMTIDLSGKWTDLVKASREALDAALKIIRPGVMTGEIGKTVQEVIQSYGYSPIRNLSGHGIGHLSVHTKPSIPNVDIGEGVPLEDGMTIAIEPFASSGAGVVYESGEAGVFMHVNKKPVRDAISRSVLKKIDEYEGLPFAKRWLTNEFGVGRARFAIKQLRQFEILRAYPPLVDQDHGIVSQAEESVLVREKPVFLTRI